MKNTMNQTILITGAARRIGKAIAIEAAKRGLNVIVHHRSSETEAHQLVETITGELGRQAWAIKAELTDTNQVKDMFSQIKEQVGELPYLINNASVFGPSPLMDTTAYELDHYISVNLTAQYRVIRQFIENFNSNDGAILNLLDWRAWKPDPWFLAYNLSKAGFLNLTTNLAVDLAPKIRVNGIAPGAILPADHEARDTQSPLMDLPIKRWGTPEEIAAAAMFLMLDGKYITGQILSVDGGRHLI